MPQRIELADDSGNPINSGNPLNVSASVTPPSAVVSTNNSTTTPLTANAVYTGTSESILAYGSVSVEVFTDQNSASNGLVIQQSQDGTNWDTKASYTVTANTAFQQTVNATGQFLQVKYTNGTTNQTVFRLQTVKEVNTSPSAGVSNQRVNAQSGDFVAGSIVDLATVVTNTTGLATQTTLAQVKTDLDTLVTNTADLLADGDNLATISTNTADLLADGDNLATIATNTTGAATAANQSTGNTSLSTIAGAVSGTKMQSNVAQVAGTTTSVNAGTADAGTQRIIQAGAATGTKTSVSGSASSTTILASNTSRKGAMVYNDSTALLYLDLSGGTASSSSYSVQVPSQAFFEVPGPTIYNGAITGIWASAVGNARVTEFS